jgi:hypothetical protein
MAEGKLLAVVLIAAALLFPAAVKGGREPASDPSAWAAEMATRNASPGAESFPKRGEGSRVELPRLELLRLLAAAGTESSGPGQARVVQLIRVMALATEGLPLLLRR